MVNWKAGSEIVEAWQNGLELEEALSLFAPQIDRAELMRKGRVQRSAIAIGKRRMSGAGVNADQLFDALKIGQLQLSAATQARESRKRQLIEALENGELLALGYPVDRPKAAKPELIPAFLIQLRSADFRKSEFSDRETRFAKVRIVPGSALAKPKIGRPSIRDRVAEIASQLVKANDITKAMPPKVQAGKIRETGKRQFPAEISENSPSEQTIKRHLKTFWNSN